MVPRAEAFARVQAACDARDEGKDIWILARTDALIVSWDEMMARVAEFERMGVDAVFIEALPDKASMQKCMKLAKVPQMVNSTYCLSVCFGSGMQGKTDTVPQSSKAD